MNDLTVDVYANAEPAIEDIERLKKSLKELSELVDDLEAKGLEIEIKATQESERK